MVVLERECCLITNSEILGNKVYAFLRDKINENYAEVNHNGRIFFYFRGFSFEEIWPIVENSNEGYVVFSMHESMRPQKHLEFEDILKRGERIGVGSLYS
jgi:hypothetical protein